MTKNPGGSGTPGVTREFIGVDAPTARRAGSGGHPCQGIYYRGVGRKPKVAMIAAHYQIDFSEHYLADYMATRGVGFLGWNTRFRGFESTFLLDHALVDIGVGVRWLREVQGVETVVLLGNSGGGSLMAAYQAQAVDPHVTPLDGMRPAAGLNDLLPADGYVASAAHPGRPDVLTAWMDGSVVDECDPVASDRALDPFDERNGPPFSADFIERYRAAQVARNHAITEWAEIELKRVRAAGFSDRPFTVLRTWADLRMVDPTIEPTKRPANTCYAGVPVKASCAGVAMGLIKEGARVAVLTDILGTEDHLGDMDFKVAGTREGVTSIQMDIKIEGLDFKIVAEALDRAKQARIHILDIMDRAMPQPRSQLSKYAPRIITIQIPTDKIGDIIGPKGKTIRSIQEQTGAEINVDDNGLVTISAVGEGGERARDIIAGMVQVPEVGKVYEGVVKSTTAFGAFIEILPGVEGLLHISELQHGRTERTEDVVKKGDQVRVKLLEVDERGRMRLSRKALLEKTETAPARSR